MAQQMCTAVGRLDSCPAKSPVHDPGHGEPSHRAARRQSRDEHLWHRQRRSSAAQIGDDGVADLLRQRQPVLAPTLAAHGDTAVLPVDGIEGQLGDLAGAQPQPGEQEEYCPVPGPNCILIFARVDYLLHIFRLKEPRRGGELVGREAGHRVPQAVAALPGGGEEPQERAHRRSDQLRCCHLVAVGPRYHKAANSSGAVVRRDSSQSLDEIGCVALVAFHRAALHSLVLQHPVPKLLQQWPALARRQWLLPNRHDASLPEEPDKHSGSAQ